MGERVIVVGAGASGGVIAARLSEDPDRSVLLLEAGPDFPDEADFPPGFMGGGHQFQTQYASDYDWHFWSEPLRGNGRRIRLPRGKLVGGSSMVNGTMCVRAAPFDFERWQANGAPGWSWESVVPAYEAAEREVPLRTYPREAWQPIQAAYYEAWLELGYRECGDMNAPDAWRGTVGPTPMNRLNEVRLGTLVTYLRRARGRPNLDIRGNALVDRVLLRDGRATGVRWIDDDGRAQEAEADLVVVCGGAYCTPGILIRSGIGPADDLRRLGVDVVADLPVGRTLLDHPVCYAYVRAPGLTQMRSPSASIFARDRENVWFTVASAIDEANDLCGLAFVGAGDNAGGSVEIVSTDPTAKPLLRHVYEEEAFGAAWRVLDELLATKALAGVENLDAGRSWQEVVAERMSTTFHAAGSCPIGAVVDDELRVLGVEGLAVADASVFPVEISNNTNLTCYMIGERFAMRLAGAPDARPQEPAPAPAGA